MTRLVAKIGDRAQPSSVLPGSSRRPRKDEAQEAHKSVVGTGKLVPMTGFAEMMADMVKRIPPGELKVALEALRRVTITFATMCSGTEAPLIAMEEIKRVVMAWRGVVLRYKHLFSVEIEAHKQAYIERNFNPDILFTDVRDVALGGEAPTAYGGLRDVPGGVSIVVAGFACVDFSTLNPKRKDVQDAGESGDTLRAILTYAARFRPRAMILENVGAAEWVMIQVCTNNNWKSKDRKGKLNGNAMRHLKTIWGDEEASSGYSTCVVKVDTKEYYLPQTRKRCYMVCIDRKTIGIVEADKLAQKWAVMLKGLQRNASSPMDDFLLSTDDPRVRAARNAGGMDEFGDRKRRTESTWVKCKLRYAAYRETIACGAGRPLTRWSENGACHPPEHWWKNWAHYQSDRLREHWDISHLRSAQRGYDSQYKTRVWELSQNIDRSTDTSPWGIAQCITPTAQPHITSRGGIAIPTECLILQGLPPERLDLGRLTHAQVQDLAGNAMSTTVVGAAMLALLVTAPHFLTDFLPQQTPVTDLINEEKLIAMQATNLSDLQSLDIAPSSQQTLQDLTRNAQPSTRMCGCESQEINTEGQISRCKHCNHTCCARCITQGIHEYDKVNGQERKSPAVFARFLKDALPMRLHITGDLLLQLPHQYTRNTQDVEDLGIIAEALESLGEQEFRFTEVLRTYCWTVNFEARSFSLKLKIHNGRAAWLLFLKPGKDAIGDDPVRRIARNPIARMILDPEAHNLSAGTWEVSVPSTHTFNVNVNTKDYATAPSWRAQLGLPDHEDEEYHLKLDISTITDPFAQHPRLEALSGTYELLPKCETAQATLYKKTTTEPDGSQIYFFLDPSLHMSETLDRYVFATTHERLKWGEVREVIASLKDTWHASEPAGMFPCIALGHWIPCKWQLADRSRTHPVLFATMTDYSDIRIPDGYVQPKEDQVPSKELAAEERRRKFKLPDGVVDCNTLHTVLASVLVPLDSLDAWNSGAISPAKQRQLSRQLAWAYDRLSLHSHLPQGAVQLAVPSSPGTCETCAPSLPIVRFARSSSGKKFTPYEDAAQAIDFERAFKARAPIVAAALNDNRDGHYGRVDIAVNWVSLAHRAMAKLPYKAGDDVALECCIQRFGQHTTSTKLPPFTLAHCKKDPPFEYRFPSSKRLRLRPEQARAFRRMLDQEDETFLPAFAEEAREEALLPEHQLRVHALFSKKSNFLGGVLAHEVGFGKTALILALIDHTITRLRNTIPQPVLSNIRGKIASNATLVIVPSTIVKQWKSQAEMFLGQRHYQVLAIGDVGKLASTTVSEIQEADIVIISSRLFESITYKNGIAVLGCFPPQHNTNSRLFQAWYDRAAEGMAETVERIKALGLGGLAAELDARFVAAFTARDLVKPTHNTRLKGKEYAEDAKKKAANAKQAEKKKKKKKKRNEDSDAEADSEADPDSDSDDGNSSGSEGDSGDEDPRDKLDPGDEENPGDEREGAADDNHGGDGEDDDGEAGQAAEAKSKTRKRKRPVDVPVMVDEPMADEAPELVLPEISPEELYRNGKKEAYDMRRRFKLPDDGPPDIPPDDDIPPGSGERSKTASEETSKKATKKSAKEPQEPKETKQRAKRTIKEPPTPSKLLSDMKNPMLQMFQFRRVVIDEFTYVDDNAHTLIAAIEAPHRWVISGTPRLGDFMDIKGLAAFMKFLLGEDDDTPGIIKAYNVKKLRKQRTNAEIFRSLGETRSMEFHLARHLYAQQWLDRFARQDRPEIDEIKVHTKYLAIPLTSTERATELEMYQSIDATGVTSKTPRASASKIPNDRIDRVRRILKACKTTIEVLLVLNSFFQWPKFNEQPKKTRRYLPSYAINRIREAEMIAMISRIRFQFEKAAWLEKRLAESFPEIEQMSPLRDWLFEMVNEAEEGAEEEEVSVKYPFEVVKILADMILNARPSDDDQKYIEQDEPKASVKKGPKTPVGKAPNTTLDQAAEAPPDDDVDSRADVNNEAVVDQDLNPSGDAIVQEITPVALYEQFEQLDTAITRCHSLATELVSRLRGIRFSRLVAVCQQWVRDPEVPLIECSTCHTLCSDIHATHFPGPCGHVFCGDCFAQIPPTTGICVIPECNGILVQNSQYTAALLGTDADDDASQRYGAKVGRITQLILHEIPHDEQVILFLQHDQLLKPLSEAFEAAGVSNIALYDSNKKKHGRLMEEFQDTRGEDAKRMLILDATKDTAAGANLTNANHVIFLGPFWADTHHLYHQSMTQCIGRARRYGQRKEVHVYRMIALDTVDVDVIEWREGKKLVRLADGSFDLKAEQDLTDEERAAKHFDTGFVQKQGYIDKME